MLPHGGESGRDALHNANAQLHSTAGVPGSGSEFGAPLSRKLEKRNSYLVDPASSHMLVSKIKPCMCKYKLFCTVKLRMAH